MNDFDTLHDNELSDSTDYYSFYSTATGNLIDSVTEITVVNGKFENIKTSSGEIYTPEEYTYTREVLYVLGVGYLMPGDIVKLKLTDKTKYTVGYGWHTNVSNQTLYSWYLIPVNDKISPKVYQTTSNILTLYKEYLDTIELVEYKRERSTFYIGGEPNG